VVGQFFAALSVTLAIAVLVSLVLALTLMPLLADQFLRAEARLDGGVVARAPAGDGRLRGWWARVGRAIDGLTDHYGRALNTAIHHPAPLVAVAVALVAAGGSCSASSAPASCRSWTRARSCSTT
jgi:HAE1 family hydrophobic/amphiphilic exporter-1